MARGVQFALWGLFSVVAWAQEDEIPLLPISRVQVRVSSQNSVPAYDWAGGRPGDFRPGASPKNLNPADFVFDMKVDVDVQVKALTLVHNVCGEAWSTTRSEKYIGSSLAPLVIYQGRRQINKSADEVISLKSGLYQFYVQPVHAQFKGGFLRVEMVEGTDYLMPLGEPSDCALEPFKKYVAKTVAAKGAKASEDPPEQPLDQDKVREAERIMKEEEEARIARMKAVEDSLVSRKTTGDDVASITWQEEKNESDVQRAQEVAVKEPEAKAAPTLAAKKPKAAPPKPAESATAKRSNPVLDKSRSFMVLNCALERCP